MRIVGTYSFTISGDGTHDEIDIRLDAIRTPEPLVQGRIPTGIAGTRLATGPGSVTATLSEGNILRLKFSIPPPSGATDSVTVDALFGTDY